MTEHETSTPPMAYNAPLAYAAQQVEDATQQVEDAVIAAAAAVAGGRRHFPVHDNFDPSTHRHIGDPGRPTMRGMLRKERGGGYTKYTILSDIIDESMLNCIKKHGHLLIDFYASSVDERKLSSIIVYDDIDNGFMGLDIDGEKNPLNLIHYGGRRHTSDEEWSQWGVGLTAASMCCSTSWELITRFKTREDTFKYARLRFCWEEMAGENVVRPQHTEISEAAYNALNPFHKGTVFKYTGCFSDIFSGNFNKNVRQLVQMISTKYYKALTFASGDVPHVKYRMFDSIGDEIIKSPIMPDIPPTEQPNHPHDVWEWQIQVRKNERGDEKIIFKESTPSNNTKWNHEQPDNSDKFKALRTSEHEELIAEFPNVMDVIKMKGTRVSGTEWCHRAYPEGSLVIERYGRVMTEDIRADGRYLGFCMQPKNGESNYHYYHMNYKHKPIGKNFSDTYRKIIDGNLMINDTPLNRVLRQCTKKLRAKIGPETAFKKKWKRDHSNLVEWNEDLTYQGNIDAAVALPAEPVILDPPLHPEDCGCEECNPAHPEDCGCEDCNPAHADDCECDECNPAHPEDCGCEDCNPAHADDCECDECNPAHADDCECDECNPAHADDCECEDCVQSPPDPLHPDDCECDECYTTPPPPPLPPTPPTSFLAEIIGTLALANEETCDPSHMILPQIIELVRLLQIPNFADMPAASCCSAFEPNA
jgi:hypothetical protein